MSVVSQTGSGRRGTAPAHERATGRGRAAAGQDLASRNAAHAMEIYLLIGEAEARELMAGIVPASVQQMAVWALEDVREAPRQKASR